MEIKYYYSQGNSIGTDRESNVPGNLHIMKVKVRHRLKPTFLLKIFTYTMYGI